MKKAVFMDLRRLSRGKAGILICILSPVLILLCFAATIAPVFFETGNGFEAVLLCEDKDPLTLSVVQSLVESEKGRAVIQLTEVTSLEEGRQRIQNGAVCMIRIPAGFQKALLTGGQSTITFYKNAAKPLQSAIVSDVLLSGVHLVNKAQTAVNVLYNTLAQADKEKAQKIYSSVSKEFMLAALDKNDVFQTETVSPLGSFLPVEYYAAAFMVLFLSLSALSLFALTASDIENGIVSRRLSAGYSILSIAAPRIISGALFVFLQGLPLLLLYLPVCLSSFAYGGSLTLMPLCLAALSLFISAFSFGLSVFMKNSKSVLLVLALLLLAGGVFIPVSYFGMFFAGVAGFSPFSALLRMVLSSFFFFQQGSFILPFLITVFYTAVFSLLGAFALRRKA